MTPDQLPPLVECEAAGEVAGRDGAPFDACPYRFVAASVDQATFEQHYRPRLDAWFNGWNRTRPPRQKKLHPRWHKAAIEAAKKDAT